MAYFFVHGSASSCCHWHRLIMPMRHWSSAHKHEIRIEDKSFTGLFKTTPSHLFLHGVIREESLSSIGRLKDKGCRIVWNIDDDFWDIPEWSPVKISEREFGCLKIIGDMSEHIICSTPRLVSIVQKKFPSAKAHLGENLIFRPHYNQVQPHQDHLRVMWQGSQTHVEDLLPISKCLDLVAADEEVKNAVEFWFVGYCTSEIRRKYLGELAIEQKFVEFEAYPSLLCSINPNVCLAPISDHPFNASKSNLKVLESLAMGAVPIGTGRMMCLGGKYGDPGPYGKILAANSCGFVANSGEEYYRAIRYLVKCPEKRKAMAAAGRSVLNEEWVWDLNNPRPRGMAWNRILDEIAG